MDLRVKDQLTEQDIETGLKNIVRENLAFQVMATTTGGVFVVALANQLGASNLVIGLLAAIGPLAQLIQIPAIYLVDRIQNRRLICVVATVVARSLWLGIALIPFLLPNQTGLLLLIAGLGLHSACTAVSNCSWGSWMRDVVPQERMGAFFSRRMALAAILGMILNLIAGAYIDTWRRLFPEQAMLGYSLLFIFGAIAGLAGVFLFTVNIPEPRMIPSRGNILSLLAQPFREVNFRNLLVFEATWNFAVNLAAPFFTVYMLNWLGFDLSSIIILTTLSQVVNITILRTWGSLVDRFSNRSVLNVCAMLFILCILGWTFTTLPERYILTIPLLIIIHVVTGLSTAGVSLATGNMGLKLAPRGQATSYLAARSLVNSLAASTAPIIGGQFADFFEDRSLSITLSWSSPGRSFTLETLDFQHWDFFFFFAFVIGLFSIYRLALVRETGDVPSRMVMQEFTTQFRTDIRRGMHNLSTVGGLYQMVWFPISLIRHSLMTTARQDDEADESDSQPVETSEHKP